MKKDLSGTWQFVLDSGKAGISQAFYKKTSFEDTITLPTTTAEAKKGMRGDEKYTGYLTETYHFEGYAWYLREIDIQKEDAGNRFFFVMERTRKSTVWVDGEFVGHFESFYAKHRYELTNWLSVGTHTLTVLVDNTDYVTDGGHMTSPDTQTNWNGILGEIYLETTRELAIEKMLLYPSRREKSVEIRLELSGGTQDQKEEGYTVKVSCRRTRLVKREGMDYEHFDPLAMQSAAARQAGLEPDRPYVIETVEELPDWSECYNGEAWLLVTYPLGTGAGEWDEYEPNVYELTVRILRGGDVLCERTSHFGLRDFTCLDRKLYCNDKEIFLRGTHDGLAFPLTGYAPMDLDSWIHVYGTAKEYGLNHVRYHTSCPPRAAFLAASYLGIYIEAELPFWGSIYAPVEEQYDREKQDFLLAEGVRALDTFGDMPSYFGMSMGNELWGSKEEINRMMGVLRAHDNRHLYTQGSNNHQFVPSVLPNDDFFCGVRFSKNRLFRGSYAMCDAPLGFVQTKPPGAYWDYDAVIVPREDNAGEDSAVKGGTIQIQYGTGIKEVEVGESEEEFIPHVPVISHEIGQYEFTPDFDEIAQYTGVLQPENFKIFKERMATKGLLQYAKEHFRASGKLAADCYKAELEAALRSAELSGFQLLDIKDYPGQGTALVGIFNALMRNKGIVTRKEWCMSCSDAVLLPTLERFVMKGGDTVNSVVKLRYYRPQGLGRMELTADWYLVRAAGAQRLATPRKVFGQSFACPPVAGRGLFTLGKFALHVPECAGNAEYLLRFTLGDDIRNEYRVFVYEDAAVMRRSDFAAPENVCITDDNKLALAECKRGKQVLLFVKPGACAPGDTIQGDYCTDFWCYPMFRSISEGAGKPVPIGTMGLLIDSAHPAMRGFACEDYTTAQWYPIITNARPIILDKIADMKDVKPIVRVMDNFERNHNLGLIYEVSRGAGKLLVCHADLPSLIEKHPEAACLYRSLVDYVAAEA